MMCGITGTPGTGKSMIGDELARRGHTVVHLTIPYVLTLPATTRSGTPRSSMLTAGLRNSYPLTGLWKDISPTCFPVIASSCSAAVRMN